jgi:threonine dehydratase
MLNLPTFADVQAAAGRLKGHAHRHTRARSAARMDAQPGRVEVFFKCENFQRMGAFKFRGALQCAVALRRCAAPGRRDARFPAGNHAQAVALSARMLGLPAADPDAAGRAAGQDRATRGYGAEVVLFDRYTQDREQLGAHWPASAA